MTLILNTIYDNLKETYSNKERILKVCPELVMDFENWISSYSNINRSENNKNSVVFNINNQKEYCKAVIYYISGMTDNFAIKMYNKIIKY